MRLSVKQANSITLVPTGPLTNIASHNQGSSIQGSQTNSSNGRRNERGG